MKKVILMLTALLLVSGALGLSAFAETEKTVVYVTVSDSTGLVMAREAVEVTDIDGDEILTVNDALYAAHEAKYDGGAEAGYYSYSGDYGLSLGKLWGDESGSYGYCVNNASSWSLADTVKDGDEVAAYVYTDLTAWSDTYCYFDVSTVSAKAGEAVTLTLYASGYDAEFKPVTYPVEGAVIVVDGTATSEVTDSEGKVSFSVDKQGSFVVSASSDTQILVPPVCIVTVSEEESEASADTSSVSDTDTSVVEESGCKGVISSCALSVVACITAFVACEKKRERS